MGKQDISRSAPAQDRRLCVLACIAAGLVLAGCASHGAAEAGGDTKSRPPLVYLTSFTGAQAAQAPLFPTPPTARPGAHLYLRSPVAAVARNNIMYIVDAGHRQILRHDPARLSLARFADYVPAEGSAAIAVGPDLSLYVADIPSGQVMHFAWDGRPLSRFGHDIALRRPVGVVLEEATGQVLIADSLYNHVVVFNSVGSALTTLKSREAHGIESMAGGPDGLYLVDRVGRQVVVMGLDGVDRYVFGSDKLGNPHAIAVDRNNRVYVSDDFDNTIKVFEGGEWVATVGGSGSTPARFNRISFLSIDRNTLYVADSLNARVQSFQLLPALPRRSPPE